MTLIEEAIDRMLEAEREVVRLNAEGLYNKLNSRAKATKLDAAVERRERYRRTIIQAFDAFTPKPVTTELTRTQRERLREVHELDGMEVYRSAVNDGSYTALIADGYLDASPPRGPGAAFVRVTLTEKAIREICTGE